MVLKLWATPAPVLPFSPDCSSWVPSAVSSTGLVLQFPANCPLFGFQLKKEKALCHDVRLW